jgi:hypothetical protein
LFRALDANNSRCDVVDGWLTAARKRAPGPFGREWDAGYTKASGALGDPPNITPVNPVFVSVENGKRVVKRLETQFIQGFTPEAPKNLRQSTRPASSGYDPFWNVKASTGAVSGHNGYVSYQTWCAINQLLLDDITARP